MTRIAIKSLILLAIYSNGFSQSSLKKANKVQPPLAVIAYYAGHAAQVDSFAAEK